MFWLIFSQLIRRDLLIFKREYWGKLLDLIITFAVWVAVFGYLTPLMGMEGTYGVFIMVGAIASFGIFEIVGQSSMLITDMQGDRTISYLLLLPISTRVIFCYMAVSWALQSMLIGIPLYIAGKLIFWTTFDLSKVSYFRFALGFLTINIFFGFFALWIAGTLRNIRNISRLYFRFINPLFIIGCYFFPWAVAYKLSPIIGVICLLDPLSYVMELMRSAIIGQEEFLPFWVSFAVLWGFILALGSLAIRSLKKHLDCV